MPSKKPFVSIIIVNFNGAQLLSPCLDSIAAIDYPKDRFEIIVVDNDSQDTSVDIIRKQYPWVKLIESQINLGFTGGNNLGLTKAMGEYIVLLNTDTRVDQKWLSELVRTAQSDDSIGIVNSKLLFDIPFVELALLSDIGLASDIYTLDDFSPLGLIIENIEAESEQLTDLIHYGTGFYPANNHGNYVTRWTNGKAKVLLPFTGKAAETFTFLIHGHPHTRLTSSNFEVRMGDIVLYTGSVGSKRVKEVEIAINRADVEPHLIWLVQNAGNVVFKNGQSRDRGAVITMTPSETTEFYDFDTPYFARQAKILSACAASCLIKRSVIETIGLFEPSFFMYYEDVDVSLSAWRMGFDIVLAPKSIVFHKHKASTNKQGEVFFSSMVLKNHLFLLIKHFPIKLWFRKLCTFMIKMAYVVTLMKVFSYIGYYGSYNRKYAKEADSRYRAFVGIRQHLITMLKKRSWLQQNQRRSYQELADLLY